MKTIVINLGGEDYSVEFENESDIYSVQDMNGKEIDFHIDVDFHIDIIDKLNQ